LRYGPRPSEIVISKAPASFQRLLYGSTSSGDDIRAGPPVDTSSRQPVKQRLRLFQIGGGEPPGEPAVEGCQQIAVLGEMRRQQAFFA
jgi:hypothetical protein